MARRKTAAARFYAHLGAKQLTYSFMRKAASFWRYFEEMTAAGSLAY